MATNYIGNNDDRWCLNYLAQNGDKGAGTLLYYVGNDGGVANDRKDYAVGNNFDGVRTSPDEVLTAQEVANRYYSVWQNQAQAQAQNQTLSSQSRNEAMVGK